MDGETIAWWSGPSALDVSTRGCHTKRDRGKTFRDPRACVVYQQELAKYWAPGANIQAKPMVRYIRESFHTVIKGYGYSLMMRNGPAG